MHHDEEGGEEIGGRVRAISEADSIAPADPPITTMSRRRHNPHSSSKPTVLACDGKHVVCDPAHMCQLDACLRAFKL